MKTATRYFPVHYTWTDSAGQKRGHSVADGFTLAEALAKFSRQHPHITVIAPNCKPSL